MKKSFNELRSKMTPARREQASLRAREAMAEMLLSEIRRQTGLTQEDLAEALGITQPTLSKMESQTDMQISTLRRLVEALGGNLELIAHMPGGDVRIGQFVPRAG